VSTAKAEADEPVESAPEAPLLELRDGLPDVAETPAALSDVVAGLHRGHGPIAIDVERASGYRYSPRAYLIQLRREGSGTALVDPIAFDDLSELAEALRADEWILHAASQDLPSLSEIDMRPSVLFDTELAGRLLGYPRVGLGTLVETVTGFRMRKEHSAVDWSKRPLPQPWLEYAALDVEVLIELRERLSLELEEAGKTEWARQEFAHVLSAAPAAPRQNPWRRTSGLHRARGRRAMAAVRELWVTRDEIAARRDISPGRIIPDSAIVEAANALPTDRRSLLGLKGFRGRGAERYSRQWVEALEVARRLPDAELPPLTAKYDGPPPPRAWAERDPVAARRLRAARAALTTLAEELNLPLENLLTPDYVRRLLWETPDPGDDALPEVVAERLRGLGARAWQVELTTDLLAEAIVSAGADPAEPTAPAEEV
jgi:ribonuclease D